MRFFEISNPNVPTQQSSTVAKQSLSKSNNFYFDANGQNIPVDQSENAAFTTASAAELRTVVAKVDAVVKSLYPDAKTETKTATMPPHIRVFYAPFNEIEDDISKALGSNLLEPTDPVIVSIMSNLTGDKTFVKRYVEIDGKIYPFVFNQATSNSTGESNAGPVLVGNKQLTPDRLFGMGAEFPSADALADATKQKLSGIKDDSLRAALLELVDVANGKLSNVNPDLMAYIYKNGKSFNNISKDFGEVLTPIMIARQEGQAIAFPPASNEAMVDVYVGGQPVAVKSLSGSGNGMDSIMDMIDNYQDAISGETDDKRKKLYSILKGQQTIRGKRTSLDNMVATAYSIPTNEAIEIQQLLGAGPFNSYKEFESAVFNWVKQFDQYSDIVEKYTAYLEAIKPISIKSGYGKKTKNGVRLEPIGMPSDATKYISYKDIGGTDKGYREARSGLPTFKKNFAKAAALQLVYLLAVSSERLLKPEGADGEAMTNLLTDIMRNKGAYAAHIEINKDGSISMIKKPFKDLRFGYQYHAATDAPNRNAPGWHIIFK